jgi:hypothetical protein
MEFNQRLRDTENSVVHVFSFDLQLLLAGFANPVMLPVDEGMVVDTFAVIFRAQIAFHYLRYLLSGLRTFETASSVSLSGIWDFTALTFSCLMAS